MGGLHRLPGTPRSSIRQVRRGKALGWISKRHQEEQTWKTRRGGRSPDLLRLASPERMRLGKPSRATQVLRMRKNGPWSPALSSRREGLSLSLRTLQRPGPRSSSASGSKTNIPLSFRALRMAFIWEFPRFFTHIPRSTIIQLIIYALYIIISWKTNLQLAGTSVPSLAVSWRPSWALSKCCHFPSSPKP